MTDVPSAFPLAWPAGRPRTRHRWRGGFGTTQRNQPGDTRGPKPLTLHEARERLARQCELMGAKLPVLSSNVELRLDGRTRAMPVDDVDMNTVHRAIYEHVQVGATLHTDMERLDSMVLGTVGKRITYKELIQ